jgi:hypothetical protein
MKIAISLALTAIFGRGIFGEAPPPDEGAPTYYYLGF